MKIQDVFYFAWLNLRVRKVRTFFTLFGVIVAISTMVFFLSLSKGVQEAAFTEVFKKFPVNRIVVKNDYTSLGVFQVDKVESVKMNGEVIARFSEIDRVKNVYPVLILEVPTTFRVNLFNTTLQSDVPIFGIDPEVIAEDEDLYERFSKQEEKIPTILHTQILDFYNSAIAAGNPLPQLSPNVAINKDYTLHVGFSALLNTSLDDAKEFQGIGAGFSDRVPIVGITIPIDRARELAEIYEPKDESQYVYNMVYIDVENPEDVPTVSQKIQDLGFRTESALQISEQIGGIIQNMILVLSTILIIVLLVSGFSIFNTVSMSVFTRSKEIGILRSCGATRKTISFWFLVESLLIGSVGGGVGIVLGVGFGYGVNIYLLSLIPEVSFKPSTFFLFPLEIFLLSFFVAIFMSVISGYIPSRQAAKMKPIEALQLH